MLARLIERESDALFPGTASMRAGDVAAGRFVRIECDAPATGTKPAVLHLRDRALAPAAQLLIATLRAPGDELQRADSGTIAANPPARRRRARGRS